MRSILNAQTMRNIYQESRIAFPWSIWQQMYLGKRESRPIASVSTIVSSVTYGHLCDKNNKPEPRDCPFSAVAGGRIHNATGRT
jgi:hypothetical protein